MSLATLMTKHIRKIVSGLVLLAPFALTIAIVIWIGGWMEGLARTLLGIKPDTQLQAATRVLLGAGALVVVVTLGWLAGALARWWVFRAAIALLEWLFRRVPFVKTIYDSARDILKFFGDDAANMGKSVRVKLPGSNVKMLGVCTSRNPPGLDGGRLAVYLPASYMLGGFTLYFAPEDVEDIDLPVQEVIRLSAIAQAGSDHTHDTPLFPRRKHAIIKPEAPAEKTRDHMGEPPA
jgi:uncharacterized membrane protein